MNGSMRGKALRPDAFESALEHGTVMTDLIIGLDPIDAPIADYERFGIRVGAPDLIVRPDPDTLHDLRWRPGWRVCLATPSWPDGSPAFASREVLRRVLEDVDVLGFEVMAAIEYEIRIWDEEGAPASSGISYSLNEIGRYARFLDELVPALEGLGIEVSAVHTEAGPGLLELNVEARRGLAAADDAALLKFGVKQVAASMGLRASFLAKTNPGEEGSSGHVHLSLWRGQDERVRRRGPVGRAGAPVLLRRRRRDRPPAGGIAAPQPDDQLVQAVGPRAGSPRSTRRGATRTARAPSARSAPRVPSCGGSSAGGRAPTRTRTWCSLRSRPQRRTGSRRRPRRPRRSTGDAYALDRPELPGSLEAALRAFEEDAALREALGKDFSDYYATSRAWELKAWRETVTEWERERYDRGV